MIDDMAVYIANLGKYNEGYLVGAWFTFPIDEEDVKEKIGLNEQYEEYAIHDTDNFPIGIGEYVSIEELNEMYEMIAELPDYIVECLDEFISHYGTLEEVVEHKDDIYYYPDCETISSLSSCCSSAVASSKSRTAICSEISFHFFNLAIVYLFTSESINFEHDWHNHIPFSADALS